jgi:hypothetical protein
VDTADTMEATAGIMAVTAGAATLAITDTARTIAPITVIPGLTIPRVTRRRITAATILRRIMAATPTMVAMFAGSGCLMGGAGTGDRASSATDVGLSPIALSSSRRANPSDL